MHLDAQRNRLPDPLRRQPGLSRAPPTTPCSLLSSTNSKGISPRLGHFTKIIAINEGKLRDFLLGKPQYKWLGKQVHIYLTYDGFNASRSLSSLTSIALGCRGGGQCAQHFGHAPQPFPDTENKLGFWEHCKPENCAFADAAISSTTLTAYVTPNKGPVIRQRLKRLILAVHFRKNRHITMRDLRSILAFAAFQ